MSRPHASPDAATSTVADAVVVAAGASTRMGGIDKLEVLIHGRPVLSWSVGALLDSGVVERVVIVTTGEHVDAMRAARWLPPAVVAVVAGGPRRQESVAAGVSALEAAGTPRNRVVLVHDGARPAVPPELVREVTAAAARHGAAIPLLPVSETLKRVVRDAVVETVDRAGLAAAQTPQAVRLDLLVEAFRRFPVDGTRTWTDEAALLEACSIPVHAIAGRPENLKVTLPADLDTAAARLGGRVPRVGFGHDGHPFGAGEPLALGGLVVAGAPRLHGHSDGDVALHAVADALLGAAGLGDLGRLFPADARTRRGIASAELLAEVVRRLAVDGLRPAGVDLTIIGARPRLGDRLDEMRDRIAELLGVDRRGVSVKASTGNLDGMEGAGRGISAHAVAVLDADR